MSDNKESEKGYYWVKFKELTKADQELTIGYCNGEETLPWQVVGSDEIFSTEELEIIAMIPNIN